MIATNFYAKPYRRSADATISQLYVDGRPAPLCYVLEDAVREVPGRPVAEWKVPGKTAIPSGIYRVTLEKSPRFGEDTITLNGVPGYIGVRVHAGNKVEDTEGCPLPGMEVDGWAIKGGTSGPAVAMLKALIRAALQRGEQVFWHVER